MNKQDFIKSARKCLGTRFQHQGRMRGVGLDCAGLAVWAAKDCGEQVEDFTDYKRQPLGHELLRTLQKHCYRVPLDERQAGDILVFQFDDNPQHIAILTKEEPETIIHATIIHRAVVEHIMDPSWVNRLRYVFRFEEKE